MRSAAEQWLMILPLTLPLGVAAGVWLCTLDFPGPALFAGVILILLAVEMRPRFGRLPNGMRYAIRQNATPKGTKKCDRYASRAATSSTPVRPL